MKTLIIGMLIFFIFVPNTWAGRRLSVSWEPSVETDVAGYRIYIGIKPGIYISVKDVGCVYAWASEHFYKPRKYYVAVTAIDTSGNESTLSKECIIKITGAP